MFPRGPSTLWSQISFALWQDFSCWGAYQACSCLRISVFAPCWEYTSSNIHMAYFLTWKKITTETSDFFDCPRSSCFSNIFGSHRPLIINQKCQSWKGLWAPCYPPGGSQVIHQQNYPRSSLCVCVCLSQQFHRLYLPVIWPSEPKVRLRNLHF